MCTVFQITEQERGEIDNFFDDEQNQKLIVKYQPKYGDIFDVIDMHNEWAYYDGSDLIDLGGDLDATGGFVSPFFTVLSSPYYFKIDYWYNSSVQLDNFWVDHKPYLNELLSSIHEITQFSLKSKFNDYIIVFDITHEDFDDIKEENVQQAFINHLHNIELLNLQFVRSNLLQVINCTYYD